MTLVPASVGAILEGVLQEVSVTGDLRDAVAPHVARAVDRLDPERGTLLAGVWLRPPTGQSVLLLAAHVVALDPASWRVVLGEFAAALAALAAGHPPAPVREHTSYRRWTGALIERAHELDTAEFWASQLRGDDPDLGARRLDLDLLPPADAVALLRALIGARVDADFFSTLQSTPELGRTFTEEDNLPAHAKVAVISHSLWHSMFAGKADIVAMYRNVSL